MQRKANFCQRRTKIPAFRLELVHLDDIIRRHSELAVRAICDKVHIQNKEAFTKAFREAYTKFAQPLLSRDGKAPAKSIRKNKNNRVEDAETIFPCEITTYAEEPWLVVV